ncbi:CxxH/CxxC protein [Fervidibacillus halotolerans]|uniref:CxxH/CxxC protein n=1 Tax=Fervidibacillus halotolerans TaxID=2980027 RepID=A0A9E8RWZ9_9BACI|nr:CxxH/CxxC protein [Fervidibacillus halotolerans]WAA12270.1 CxxH/CxxC protein [Fervidibacillus halotolerans]
MEKENELGTEKKVIYSCEEHVEYAMEEIINEKGTPPILKRLESGKLSTKACAYCGKLSVYIVSNEYSHTKCG